MIVQKFNKGEWSEAYVFLKLLADGELPAADAVLNRIDNVIYPIIKIIRYDDEIEYVLKENFVVVMSLGKEILRISRSEFKIKASELLENIQSASTSSFESLDTEKFMKSIGCSSIKSSSGNKRDITILLHDVKTGIQSKVGFSIKSRLGDPSTLLNAAKTTNFTFSISGNMEQKTITQINHIDTHSKIKDRLIEIESKNSVLKFIGMQSSSFQSNLQLIDGDLPKIISNLLLYYFRGNAKTMKDLVSLLQKENPCKYNLDENHPFYSYKIKHFLTDIALGMVPSSVWTGEYDASGGYIIIKENGDVLCYHIYNYNEFQEYLLQNTKLETASSTRHDFGNIKDNYGKLTFNLNLQIRFLK